MAMTFIYRLVPDVEIGGGYAVWDHVPHLDEMLASAIGDNVRLTHEPYGLVDDDARWTLERLTLADGADVDVVMRNAESQGEICPDDEWIMEVSEVTGL